MSTYMFQVGQLWMRKTSNSTYVWEITNVDGQLKGKFVSGSSTLFNRGDECNLTRTGPWELVMETPKKPVESRFKVGDRFSTVNPTGFIEIVDLQKDNTARVKKSFEDGVQLISLTVLEQEVDKCPKDHISGPTFELTQHKRRAKCVCNCTAIIHGPHQDWCRTLDNK